VSGQNYCSTPVQKFSWKFFDSDGDSQGAYWLQVDKNSDFSNFGNGEYDSGKINTSANNITIPLVKNPGPNQLGYNTTYYWRVKVWDDKDLDSEWVYPPSPWGSPTPPPGVSFTTPLHIYPQPDFEWTPLFPTQDEVVQFCSIQQGVGCSNDLSVCYDNSNNPIPSPSCGSATFSWSFPPGTIFVQGTSSNSPNPRVKLPQSGNLSVTLTICDNVGCCSKTKTVNVKLPLPRWIEVPPKD